MATAPSAPYLSDDDDGPVCGVCSDKKLSLKILPCRHMFCEYCLQKIIIEAEYRPFMCPFCRALTEVPELEASGFAVYGAPIEVHVETRLVVVDTGHVQHATEATLTDVTSAGAPVNTCYTCEIDLQQTLYFCTQCRTIACEWCQDDHLRKNHNLVLVRSKEEPASGPQNQYTGKTECDLHGGRPLTHWCGKCHVPLCEHCLVIGPHRKHKSEELSQTGAKAKQRIEQMGSRVRPLLQRLEWVHRDLSSCLDDTRQSRRDVELQIRQRADAIRQKVTELEAAAIQALYSSCNEIEQNYTEDLDNVSSKMIGMKAKEKHLTSLMTKANDVTLAKMEPSAAEHVKKKSHLTKFTHNLPREVRTVRDHSSGSVSGFEASLEKFIGNHVVEKTKRKIPEFE